MLLVHPSAAAASPVFCASVPLLPGPGRFVARSPAANVALPFTVVEALWPEEQKAAALLRAQYLFRYPEPRTPLSAPGRLAVSQDGGDPEAEEDARREWASLQRLLEFRIKEEESRKWRGSDPGLSRTQLLAVCGQGTYGRASQSYWKHQPKGSSKVAGALFKPALVPQRGKEVGGLLSAARDRTAVQVALGTLDLQVGKKVVVLRWQKDGPTVQPAKAEPPVGYICNVAVAPEARRAGVGLALMEEAACIAEALGLRAVYLRVLDDNTAAVALYEKAGFVVEEVEPLQSVVKGAKKEARATLLMHRLLSDI